MSKEADANKGFDPKEFESLFKSMNPDVVETMALSYSCNEGLNDSPKKKLQDRRILQQLQGAMKGSTPPMDYL